MYYANGDIFTGEWADGKKNGAGTYIYKESGAKVAGTWSANTLVRGIFTDKFGNSYDGAFAGSEASVGYVGGGEFSLASGAKHVLAKPTKEELVAEILAFDQDGNGLIDAELEPAPRPRRRNFRQPD